MTRPLIERCHEDGRELEEFLSERIYEFNARATGYFDGESFAMRQRQESGKVLSGISGYTWGGCCYVTHLWVAEAHRGKGWGRALLKKAEDHAREKGCMVMLLSTHSFQAPGFYRRMDYVEQASVKDHPVGHSSIFYAKRLVPTAT